MNNDKLIKVLEGLKKDLQSAFVAYAASSKDKHIKGAQGKVDVLLELLK